MAKINNLASEISKILKEYTNEVEQGIEETQDKIAKDSVKKLKANSPKLTGSYRKGWRVKTEGNKKIIHNKTDYQLTHLLENGHVNRDGSRTPAIVHIKPVEESAIKEFIEATERLIKR